MSLKKKLTELNVKLKALHFRVNHINEIIEKGERSAVERQRGSVQTLVSTINCLKGSIEEAKFGRSESESDVEQCMVARHRRASRQSRDHAVL